MSSRTAAGLLTSGDHQVPDASELETESWRDKPKCKHAYCRKGLFYDREPQHTHAQCHTCHQMARCKESASSSGTFQLRRCANCHLDQYCSKECQKEGWRMGHKETCKFFSTLCQQARELAGTPKAWPDLAEWVRFHHNSLMNATLACCLNLKASAPDVSATHFLLLEVLYRNDRDGGATPAERKFELLAADFVHREDSQVGRALYSYIAASRENAVFCARREYGRAYWGTGAYMILAHFRPLEEDPTAVVPFYKHFGIDDYHAQATPACRHPLDQLKENVELGRKMRFCCSGRPKGGDECCCGGWTHEKILD